MYNLVVSELAHNDLDNIVSYIAQRLAAPMAAVDLLDDIDRCYDHLRGNPMIYERCRDAKLELEGYRKAVVKNYILVYKVDEAAGLVTVYRFFHGTQDYANLI